MQSNNNTDINRRKFLRGFGKVIGGSALGVAVSGSMLNTAMAFVRTEDSSLKAGQVFSQPQMLMLKQICAQVIPTTDTLGAHQVDTHGFIDNQLAKCFPKAVQKAQVKLLKLLDRTAQKRHKASFVNLASEQQVVLLTDIDTGKGGFNLKQRKLFKQLKSLIAFGYYTSEVGMTEELRYLAVPGGYQGRLPYKHGEGAWAN